MNWYEWIPSFIAIYLVLISRSFETYLHSLVDKIVTSDPELEDMRAFIINVALDWADRIGLISSLVTTAISILIVFNNAQYDFLGILFMFFVIITGLPVLLWVISLPLGDLHGTVTRKLGIKPATISSLFIIVLNVSLLFAILVGQGYIFPNPSQHYPLPSPTVP